MKAGIKIRRACQPRKGVRTIRPPVCGAGVDTNKKCRLQKQSAFLGGRLGGWSRRRPLCSARGAEYDCPSSDRPPSIAATAEAALHNRVGGRTLLPVRVPALVTIRTAVGCPTVVRLNRMGRRFRSHGPLTACASGCAHILHDQSVIPIHLLHRTPVLHFGVSAVASANHCAPEAIVRRLLHRRSFSAASCPSRQRILGDGKAPEGALLPRKPSSAR